MPLRPPRSALAPVLFAALAPVALAGPAGPIGQAAALDPFAPGLRWTHAASPAAPWIPAGVAFAAGGEWVWAAAAYQTPALLLLASAAGDGAPLVLADPATPAGAQGPIAVGAPPADPTRLFALRREEAPGQGGAERALLSAHDPVAAAGGAPFAPVWTHDPGLATTGGARLALDRAGAHLALALLDPAAGTVLVDRVDPELGTLLARRVLPGGTLRALAAADGGELLVAAGADLWVLGPSNEVLHHEPLTVATEAFALSADGETLLVGALAGGAGRLRVLVRGGGGFAEVCSLAAGAGELPVRAAVSADGGTVAVAWWDAAGGAATRLEVWDGGCVAAWNVVQQSGAAGGLQNWPQALALTADGRRVALGLWGLGDAQPEVLLLERGVAAPLLAVDLGGSVRDLALGPDGTRVAVAQKHAHANQFAATGEVRLYDTGERDLQVDGVPRAGGTLGLVHRRAGAVWTAFVLGRPASAPLALPGVLGALLLDPAAPSLVLAALPDAAGVAELSLPLPSSPAVVGLTPAFQALSALGAAGAPGWALSAWLAVPVVL